jgi:multicomponent Na+:H+ antiporter subunit A
MILDVVVRAEFHVLLIVSVYLLFAGHNQPGGGFVGGLVAGSACALRMVARGPDELRRAIRVRPMTLLGLGLTTAATTALAGLWNNGQLLQTRYLSVDVPFIGPVGTSTAFFFDLGVYLVVLGAVLIVLEALGSPEEEIE